MQQRSSAQDRVEARRYYGKTILEMVTIGQAVSGVQNDAEMFKKVLLDPNLSGAVSDIMQTFMNPGSTTSMVDQVTTLSWPSVSLIGPLVLYSLHS